MRKVLLYSWQLPQNLLGLLVIFFTDAKKNRTGYWEFYKGQRLCEYVPSDKWCFGVSLGSYIIVSKGHGARAVRHEWGHQRQSLRLGWLYLPLIGILSFCGNLYDRFFHRKWELAKRAHWYYLQPWEKWADKLGGVER